MFFYIFGLELPRVKYCFLQQVFEEIHSISHAYPRIVFLSGLGELQKQYLHQYIYQYIFIDSLIGQYLKRRQH